MSYSVDTLADRSLYFRSTLADDDPLRKMPIYILEARHRHPTHPFPTNYRVIADHYVICVLREGEYRYWDEYRGEIFLPPCTAVLSRPGIRHCYGARTKGEEDYIVFAGALADSLATCGVFDKIAPFPQLRDLDAVGEIAAQCDDPAFGVQLRLGLAVAQLLVDCCYDRRQQVSAGINTVIEQILAAPHVHYRNDQLAEMAGLSERRMRSQFRAATGLTPAAYCERLRLNRAAALLTTTSLSVTEVAARMGYVDRMYFTRRFSHRFGAPPTEYRRRSSDDR